MPDGVGVGGRQQQQSESCSNAKERKSRPMEMLMTRQLQESALAGAAGAIVAAGEADTLRVQL